MWLLEDVPRYLFPHLGRSQVRGLAQPQVQCLCVRFTVCGVDFLKPYVTSPAPPTGDQASCEPQSVLGWYDMRLQCYEGFMLCLVWMEFYPFNHIRWLSL